MKKLIAAVVGYFNPTTDHIVGHLSATLAKLDVQADRLHHKAIDRHNIASKLKAEAHMLDREAVRTEQIAANLSKLLNP